jgi:hypothetical protein
MNEKALAAERLIKTKCAMFHITFGIGQALNSKDTDYSIHGTCKTKHGENHTISIAVPSFTSYYDKLIEFLERL